MENHILETGKVECIGGGKKRIKVRELGTESWSSALWDQRSML